MNKWRYALFGWAAWKFTKRYVRRKMPQANSAACVRTVPPSVPPSPQGNRRLAGVRFPYALDEPEMRVSCVPRYVPRDCPVRGLLARREGDPSCARCPGRSRLKK
jgi:hypothetical protein